MPYTPSPILFGATTSAGITLPVTEQRGGLAGYILTGISDASVTVLLNGLAVAYPVTLMPGDTLFLNGGSGNTITTLAALAPLDDAPPPGSANSDPSTSDSLTVQTDSDGYQTITNATATTENDGYQTIQDATATPDTDGYETVQRSAP